MLDLALLSIFPALMAYAAASDLVTMTIPNRVTLAIVAAFPVFAVVAGLPWSAIGLHVAAGGLMLAVSFGLFAAGWIGGGDAKLAAATGLWLGFEPLFDYLLLATLLGGLLTLAILGLRGAPVPVFALGWSWLARLRDQKAGVPYGIALAVAALLMYPHSPIWARLVGA